MIDEEDMPALRNRVRERNIANHVIGAIRKNRHYENTISLSEYGGVRLLDIRQTTQGKDGILIFTLKGTTFRFGDIPQIIALLQQAEQHAKALGWR